MQNIKIESIAISNERGTVKQAIQSAQMTMNGLENDAHAGDWHRQVSILALDCRDEFEKRTGYQIKGGEFAENLIVSGISHDQVKAGDRFKIGSVELEVTQIGKIDPGHDYDRFKVFHLFDMPKNGLFARVISGGEISVGDIGLFVLGQK